MSVFHLIRDSDLRFRHPIFNSSPFYGGNSCRTELLPTHSPFLDSFLWPSRRGSLFTQRLVPQRQPPIESFFDVRPSDYGPRRRPSAAVEEEAQHQHQPHHYHHHQQQQQRGESYRIPIRTTLVARPTKSSLVHPTSPTTSTFITQRRAEPSHTIPQQQQQQQQQRRQFRIPIRSGFTAEPEKPSTDEEEEEEEEEEEMLEVAKDERNQVISDEEEQQQSDSEEEQEEQEEEQPRLFRPTPQQHAQQQTQHQREPKPSPIATPLEPASSPRSSPVVPKNKAQSLYFNRALTEQRLREQGMRVRDNCGAGDCLPLALLEQHDDTIDGLYYFRNTQQLRDRVCDFLQLHWKELMERNPEFAAQAIGLADSEEAVEEFCARHRRPGEYCDLLFTFVYCEMTQRPLIVYMVDKDGALFHQMYIPSKVNPIYKDNPIRLAFVHSGLEYTGHYMTVLEGPEPEEDEEEQQQRRRSWWAW